MKVIHIKEPGTVQVVEIDGSLASMQALVNGLIEPVALEDGFIAVVNEEGEVRDLPQNGPFKGPWFLCKENFQGLTDEDITFLLAEDAKDGA